MVRRPSPLVLMLALALVACATPPTAGPRPVGPRATARPSPSPSPPVADSPEAPTSPAAASPSPALPASPTPIATPSAAVAASPTPPGAPSFPAIVAGIADEGEGVDPRAFAFDDLGDLEAAADGSVWVCNAHTVWRLTPGQPLRVVAGGHLTPSDAFDGRAGRDVGFGGYPAPSLLPDGGTNVLITHAGGLLRLGADGTLVERWHAEAGEQLAGHVPRPDGGLDLLVRLPRDGDAPLYAWHGAAAGEAPVATRAASSAEAEALTNALADSAYIMGVGAPVGAAVDGRLVIRTGTNERFVSADAMQPMFALHPDGREPEALDDGTTRAHMQDGRGRLYRFDREIGQLYTCERGGPRVPFGQPIPRLMTATALTATADGTVYLATTPTPSSSKGQRIWRMTAGTTELVGGREQPALGAPNATALRPGGILMAGPAEIWAGDRDLGRILRFRPGQPIEAVHGDPAGPEPKAGAMAAAARLDATGLARDPEGRLLFIHGGRSVWRVEADGRLALLYTAELPEGAIFGDTLHQLAVTKAGAIHVYADRQEPGWPRAVGRVLRLDGAGGATPLAVASDDVVGMGIGPEGGLRVARQATTPDGQLETVLLAVGSDDGAAEVGRIARGQPAHLLGLDAAGRWWFETAVPDLAVHRLVSYDLATKTTTPVAGFGAPAFSGDTPTDGLDRPSDLAFGPDGDAFVVDRRLIKRIPPPGP